MRGAPDFPRVRAAAVTVLALLVASVLLAGCAKAPGRTVVPPAVDGGVQPVVAGVVRSTFIVAAQDGTSLSVLAYEPQAQAAGPDGAPPRWPVAVFLHGWGGAKEDYEGAEAPVAGPAATPAPPSLPVPTATPNPSSPLPSLPSPVPSLPALPSTPTPPGGGPNRLRELALQGFLAVAYDARGFGASGGQTTVGGPLEQSDLAKVLDALTQRFATSGRIGLVGQSYGAGQALLAWAQDPRITAVAAHYGWTDLYDALLPGNVPKLEWAQFLYAYGQTGGGRYSETVHRWYQSLYTRSDLDALRSEMAERSLGTRAGTAPLYLCQGLQETLFPQLDRAVAAATRGGAFVRADTYVGGHGADDPTCWLHTVDWLRFFLKGEDTHVDAWPLLTTVDAVGKNTARYDAMPLEPLQPLYLRLGDLVREPFGSAFTVNATGSASPLADPSALSDVAGMPATSLPDDLRGDPSALRATTRLLDDTTLLRGTPELTLHYLHASDPATPFQPFQVTAQLQRVTYSTDGSTGQSQVLAHASFAAVKPSDLDGMPTTSVPAQGGQGGPPTTADTTIVLHFPWLHATLERGEAIRVVIAANDPSTTTPLARPFSARFDGPNHLGLPITPSL